MLAFQMFEIILNRTCSMVGSMVIFLEDSLVEEAPDLQSPITTGMFQSTSSIYVDRYAMFNL